MGTTQNVSRGTCQCISYCSNPNNVSRQNIMCLQQK